MSRNNRKKESKSSAYERRTYRLPYNPAPLDEDYDPLFDPEAFAPSPVKKKGRKTQKDAVEDPESSRHGKRLSDLFDIENSTSLQSKRASKPQPVHKFPPFSKYFAGLGLKLLSDDDAHPEHEDEEEEEEEEEEGSEADDESDHSRPERAILTAKSRVSTASSSKKQINGSHASGISTRRKAINGNSDSEEDILPRPPRPGQPYEWMKAPLKRKSPGSDVPAAKKAKVEEEESQAQTQSTVQTQTQTQPLTQGSTAEPPADDSVTEPESEESITEPESDPQTESETEPESDAELPQMHFYPRPSNIERKPDQPLLGPLVLDEGGVPGRRKKTQVPGSINTYLRDYQRDGIRFFWERYKDGYGGLLGDDMGLGKTIQVIGFLSAIMGKLGDNRDENRRREHVSKLQDGESWKLHRTLPPANETWPTCLIIAPSSVVPNWERELHKWGYFEVGVYANGKEERSQVLRDFKYGRLDVVVTSFDLARKDIALLDDLPWSCIIVDEVHRVKNPKSKLTDAFNDFRCHVRFGLTGTAIQNSFSELWTILDWSNRGSVGTKKEWESYVAKPLMRGQSKSASAEELSNAYEVARILRDDILPKYFLRRTKELIKDQLPEKTDEVVFCPLAPRQLEAYKRVLKTEAVQNLIRKDRPCDCGSKKPRKSCCHKSDQGDLFKYMSTLIKISNHLALILPAPSDKAEQVLRNRELSEQIFPKGAVPKYGTSMLEPEYCGKWLVLESLLKEWHKDKSNKVLIFTKSVKLLDMLDFHLKAQGLGHVKLDGQVKQNDRMALIDQFQEDPDVFVFLISTMAGGTGLNLTAANKVVIFDPNWNPAHDLQAMDRAYRYGQTRNVSVYRLLGAGSLEELIYARQVYKQQQMAVGYNASTQTRYFEGVQGDKSKQGELFGIKNIFKLHEETLATKMAIEKATLSDLDWALANIKPERKPDGTKWVYEAESKAKKHDGELNGLGALLFDDGFVPEPQGEDGIQKALKDIGVTYIHRNEDLIAENTIQRQRLKHMIEEEKKKATQKAAAKGKGKNAPLQREKTWPPKRKHHKPAPTPEQKLQARQKALLELGYVDSIDGLATFAQEFARKSREEQNDLLSELDKHTRR